MLVLFFGCSPERQELGDLGSGVKVLMEQNGEGDWGISLVCNGKTFLDALYPLHVELSDGTNVLDQLNKGFDEYSIENNVLRAQGSIIQDDVVFHFRDTWKTEDSAIKLDREVWVEGNLDEGFMTGILFKYPEPLSRDSVNIFAPGMIYGTTEYLAPTAIGGSKSKDYIRIREDRLPAPLFGAYFQDGTSFTVLNSRPDSRTTKEDSHDIEASTLIDEGFRFGAIGADFVENFPVFGYWFPGSEGGTTYSSRSYMNGQMQKWSRRYHPVKDGFRQEYQVSFRIGSDASFKEFYTGVWRWAWDNFEPRVNAQDIELAKRSLINMLGENIDTQNGITGIQKFKLFPLGTKSRIPTRTVMGFTGRSLETAGYLMADGLLENNPLAEKHRKLGESVIKTFLQLPLDPPAGEGFYFTGEPAGTRPLRTLSEPIVFLRSFGDGLKELLKAAKRERDAGFEHRDWISWARSFADWLLPQQTEEGGFPRTWKQGIGEVYDPSPKSSYTVITFLVLLSELTGEECYANAALKAGEFCWNTDHKNGVFIGGTLDNPNVIDKEAGTISLEAYLMLYNLTSDKKWLDRAVVAGNFAETWIYTWDVPMPEDENDVDLHWKKGLPTVGLQNISTGHSLVDMYMAYDVDEYAELFLLTNDKHYYDVAMILLHNTKTMLALPGREYDLEGPGWMQENWSMAPKRGYGGQRAWLPWVTTSQLNGIIEMKELDEDLYNEMINP